ncbi:hypothetical protein MiTe_04095 [Microcystis aeruginosa NIES-2520]|uniref:Uncharacterized protein n=1 Tax=Microcystis aeruginosa NIES-2520 TaxID=2303982 RepID=A0A5A5RVW0_MICAE|nr:hypothetical protein [Microcystis aeruginosa]MCA2666052.1 hypothetical protein [Microcystis sp. M045S2]MCA2713260.1 hypothetical protein [Microcystis sp. M172S2]MCA2806447.1 hypothetical protein [Microcystis sp. M114S2]MCA2834936.1 hypothetical protein [Microcystis sp. M007S1]MCA2839422.1 hypothetical protein [Microcystis sp. M078S1]MCA2841613.1 hypothetical protein [Microcystis sp. M079S1]MCA2845696.1 hypothetical protein [Microcystis sp. M074S1]NCR77641.1 hypothetical protein [Microcys
MLLKKAKRNGRIRHIFSGGILITSCLGTAILCDRVKALPSPLDIDAASIRVSQEKIIINSPVELERTERVLTTNSFSTTEGLADSNLPSSLENKPEKSSLDTLATEKTRTISTLEEWKANLGTTQASQLLPAGVNNSPEVEKWQAQASTPVDPNISPELQRLRQEFLIEEPQLKQQTLSAKLAEFVVTPSGSISTPSAFGATFGQIFGGFGFQSRTRFTNQADGGLALGGGLGDPQKIVGLDVTLAILSLFGDNAGRGSFSFKIHRSLPESFAVALGFENAINWGGTDGSSSIYGVVSKFFQLTETTKEPFSQLTLSLGVGGGRFRSEGAIEDGVNSLGVFASAGLRIVEPVSAIVEWSGQDLNAGISLIPFPKVPLTINLAGADLTGNAGDGARFVMSIGYNYFFPR